MYEVEMGVDRVAVVVVVHAERADALVMRRDRLFRWYK